MKDFVVIGFGDFADIVYHTITRKMKRRVACFVIDDEYYRGNEKSDVPVIAMSDFLKRCNPDEYTIAIGFVGKNMFDDRETKYKFLSEKGYSFENVTDTEIDSSCETGDGNIILKNAVLGYKVRIGSCNIIWSGSVFPHHNVIGSFNNIAPTVSLSGYSVVGDHCYLGNNATIKNRVKVADYTLVGAGAYVTKDTEENQVIVPCRSYALGNKTSRDFY